MTRLAAPDPRSPALPPDPLRDAFDSHYAPLVRLATALCGDRDRAEEAVQEAFIRSAPYLAGIEEGGRFAYLRQAAVNRLRDAGRRDAAAKRQVVPLRVVDDSTEERAERNDDRRRILVALDALPPRQRECLVLRFHGGLTDREVAEALGISPGSAKTHIRRGLASLRTTTEGIR